MDNPQMIPLDDVVLRDDLDPRLGQRDDDLIAQYADIFDALPPIEINQDNVLIDGWHRVRAAERAQRTEIAYVVVDTEGDDDLSDKMWAANLKHGVQYTRVQRQTRGMKLHERGLKAKDIAERCGVGVNSVYRWTKTQREKAKQERDQVVIALAEDGKTQQQIADKLDLPQKTVSNILLSQNSQMVEMAKQTAKELVSVDGDLEPDKRLVEVEEATPEPEPEPDIDDAPAEEEPDGLEPEVESTTDEASVDVKAGMSEPEPELSPSEPIPEEILDTARAAMGTFSETRPDEYVARLEASPSEWMTITDDSLSNELERELLTSAAAMCLWQEWMIWYQGEQTGAFTDVFGKIGDVFVRGRTGQWSLVAIATSKLREIMRRFL